MSLRRTYVDIAAMKPHYLPAQAEPDPVTVGTCGKKGLKQILHHPRGDAAAIIGNGDEQASARHRGRDRDPWILPPLHRVESVGYKIRHYSPHHVRVDRHPHLPCHGEIKLHSPLLSLHTE